MKKSFIFALLFLILHDISSSVRAEVSEKPFFTVKQEEFLSANMPVYAYFSELYVDHKTPEQIAKKYGLSDLTNRKYLKALADIGVIEKLKEDKFAAPVHFLVRGTSTFLRERPLSHKATELIITQNQEKLLSLVSIKKAQYYLSTPGLWLTKKDYENYKKELDKLEEKYIHISIKNRKYKDKLAFRVSSFVSLIPKWEPHLFHGVKKDY